MLLEFLSQLTRRIVVIPFSYLSWQTHESQINPIVNVTLTILTFTLIFCLLL